MLVRWRNTLKKMANEIAVTYLDAGRNQTLTYAELDVLSDTLAKNPQLQDLPPETLVGVLAFPSHPAWMISILAIWKRGGAVLLLNSDLSPAELSYRIRNAGCQNVILCDNEVSMESMKVLQSLPRIIQYQSALKQDELSTVPLKEMNVGGELAYVTYTSGSTGLPKAIALNHAGILPLTDSHLKLFVQANKKDIILQDASLDFDPCWIQFFLMCSGIPCVQWNSSVSTLELLPQFLREHQVTTVFWVPSFMANCNPLQFEGIRTIFTIGEACTAEFLKSWLPRLIILGYGPSETTVGCGLGVFSGKMHLGHETEGMKFHILAEKGLNSLENREVGQLAIAGPGLARGYLQEGQIVNYVSNAAHPSDKKNRNGFTECSIDGVMTRVFLTGDRVARDDAGDFIFHGRKDRQIKIRGKRIEVFAIEQMINSALNDIEIRVIPHRVKRNDFTRYDYLVAFMVAPPQPLPFKPSELIKIINDRCPYLSETPKEWYIIENRKAFLQKQSAKFDYKQLSTCYHEPDMINKFFIKISSQELRPAKEELPPLPSLIIKVIRATIDPLCSDDDILVASFEDIAGRSSLLWTALMQALEQLFAIQLQAKRHFHFNFMISDLIDEIAMQILFEKAWIKSANTQPRAEKSEAINVFCCPPVSGDPRGFNKISWKLAVSSYGLLMPPLFAYRNKLADESELAATHRNAAYRHYTKHELFKNLNLIAQHAFGAMRAIQASGPYHVCGYSWGGN